jgi:hypothetical protein
MGTVDCTDLVKGDVFTFDVAVPKVAGGACSLGMESRVVSICALLALIFRLLYKRYFVVSVTDGCTVLL